jgi:REP element-mobilizing transposase RayT
MINGQMNLSAIGEIAASEWLKSPEIRPDMKLELDEYIIMPNHIHGIIRIKENEYNKFNEIIPDFRWLSGFPEYLIRDESSLNNIRRYIIENPEQWTGDKFRTR